MPESNGPNLIQAGFEALAITTGLSVEELARQSLADSETLGKSEEAEVRRSAREHALKTKIALENIEKGKP